jgi:hypothetical protein
VARGAGALASGVGLAGGAVGSAAAHHSYPATYDTAQRVTVNGVVQLVRFVNPHVHVVLESALPEEGAAAESPPEAAADESVAVLASELRAAQEVVAAEFEPFEEVPGVAVQPVGQGEGTGAEPGSTLWILDLPGPGQAQRLGLTPESLPVGTPLTVLAWPSRAPGSHDLAPLTITFDANGRTVRIR